MSFDPLPPLFRYVDASVVANPPWLMSFGAMFWLSHGKFKSSPLFCSLLFVSCFSVLRVALFRFCCSPSHVYKLNSNMVVEWFCFLLPCPWVRGMLIGSVAWLLWLYAWISSWYLVISDFGNLIVDGNGSLLMVFPSPALLYFTSCLSWILFYMFDWNFAHS